MMTSERTPCSDLRDVRASIHYFARPLWHAFIALVLGLRCTTEHKAHL